jgi:hypothetical protein
MIFCREVYRSVGGLNYDTSIMHGHSGTSIIHQYGMVQYDIAKTIFTDDIYYNPSGSYRSRLIFNN